MRVTFQTTWGATKTLDIVDTLEDSDFFGITPECASELLQDIQCGALWVVGERDDYEWQPSLSTGIPFYLETVASK